MKKRFIYRGAAKNFGRWEFIKTGDVLEAKGQPEIDSLENHSDFVAAPDDAKTADEIAEQARVTQAAKDNLARAQELDKAQAEAAAKEKEAATERARLEEESAKLKAADAGTKTKAQLAEIIEVATGKAPDANLSKAELAKIVAALPAN